MYGSYVTTRQVRLIMRASMRGHSSIKSRGDIASILASPEENDKLAEMYDCESVQDFGDIRSQLDNFPDRQVRYLRLGTNAP